MPTVRSRVKIKDKVASHLPEFVRAQYPTFVAFVEAYYEFLDNNQVDINKIRDIDETLDEFVKYFKSELAHNYPVSSNLDTERFLLKHIKDQYLAKGSEASYKLLFRLLYGKGVYMDYPGKQMLRVSDGRWQQDISLFVRVDVGNPIDLIGKTVDIQTSDKIYRTSVMPGTFETTKVTANVENVIQYEGNIYELFLDKNFYGKIVSGDVVKYKSAFQGLVLPCTSKVKITNRGQGFKPGQVFQVSSGEGSPIWFKVIDTDSNGGLVKIDLIKFGLHYRTDFSLYVLPSSAVSTRKKITKAPVAISYSLVENTIGRLSIISGGSNYQEVPDIVIGGNGSGATATAVLTDGVVTDIVITNPGQNYTTAFVNIVAQAGDTGSGAEAEVFIGSIYDYTFNDKGDGFTERGYLNAGDYWDVTESGNGATATASITGGQVSGLTLVSGGANYNYNSPVIDICTPLDEQGRTINTGRKAKATATVVNGIITGFTITDPGSGYITVPKVTITGAYGYADGAYVGTLDRQFFVDAKDTISGNPALLNVTLDALAKYPGYYKSNEGFLDDSMYIQDSYYYQAFSYVIRIDEQLQSYAAVVRSMLHPSGMAMFGEYSINNNFDLKIALQSLVKSLGITLYDSVSMQDGWQVDENGIIRTGTFFSVIKDISDPGINPIDIIQKFVISKVLFDSATITEPFVDKSFTKKVGYFDTDSWVYAIEEAKLTTTKSVVESYSGVTETLRTNVVTKAFVDTPIVTDLKTINIDKYYLDATSGVYNEDGYIVLNSYEEGGYFAEIYANGRATEWTV